MAIDRATVEAYLNRAKATNDRFKAQAGQTPDKPADGANTYFILPAWASKDPMDFDNSFRRYARHYAKNPGPGGGKIEAVTLCEKNTFGGKCPVCDAYWAAKNSPGFKTFAPDVQQAVNGANASTRYLVNALHCNSAEPLKPIVLELPYGVGVQLFGDPKTGSQGLFQQYISMKGAIACDLAEGTTFIIRRTGTGVSTKYSAEMGASLASPIPASVMDNLTDLDAYINNWKHTPEDEGKAISTLYALANSGAGNQAISMGAGAFVQAAPVQQAAFTGQNSFAQPQVQPVQQQAPSPFGQTQQTQPVAQQAPKAELVQDVFNTPPSPHAADDGLEGFDIDTILAGI